MSSLRRRGVRGPFIAPRARVLIVCEGGKTEPIYFEALRKHRRLTATEVRVCPSERGSHPKSVVECAVQLVNDAKQTEHVSGDPYEAVWCVFDRDSHANIHEAIDRADAREFRLAYSNPCFELWYLLHYEYTTAHINSRTALSKVNKRIPEYGKSANVYDQLIALQSAAMSNAEKLKQHHESSGGLNRESNPHTTVDELVTYLNGLEPPKR